MQHTDVVMYALYIVYRLLSSMIRILCNACSYKHVRISRCLYSVIRDKAKACCSVVKHRLKVVQLDSSQASYAAWIHKNVRNTYVHMHVRSYTNIYMCMYVRMSYVKNCVFKMYIYARWYIERERDAHMHTYIHTVICSWRVPSHFLFQW